MAVHPLRGSRLRVIRFERAQDGRRYVLAEHSRGWGIHLPEEWTDRGAPLSPTRLGKREAKLALDGLLQLTRAVDTLQETSRVASQSVLPGAPTRGRGAHGDRGAKRLGRSPRGTSGSNARGLGRAGAQGAMRRGRGRGGRR